MEYTGAVRGRYLKAYRDGRDDRVGIGDYFRFYNTERPHQALDYPTPAEVFASIPVEATHGSMVEALTLDTLRTAEPNLNIASILSNEPEGQSSTGFARG